MTLSLVIQAAVVLSAAQASSERPVAGPVQLQAQRSLHNGEIDQFPVVLAGPAVTAAVAQRINAALRRDQVLVNAAAEDCRASFKDDLNKPAPADAWTRTVEVTMKGPRYLSMMATDSYYCGGAYPNDGLQMPLVYDLDTGAPVDWIRLMPKGVSTKPGNGADGAKAGWVVWPTLTRIAKEDADPDCKDAFMDSDSMGFQIALDARAGELQATPTDFPHVYQACANPVALSIAKLRRLGFAPALVTALEAAHQAQQR